MRTKRLAAALAAVALLFTAACGDGESDAETAASASATESADGGGSADAGETEPSEEPSDEPGADAGGSDVDPAAFGKKLVEAQIAAGTVHMEGTLGGAVTMSGVMDFAAGSPAMDMKMSGGQLGGDARMILVDQTMYMQVPGTGMGDKFLKIDTSDPDSPLAKSMQSMDPSTSFRAFEAVTSLERVGQEKIAGVDTTHYKVTIDTARSLKAQGVDPRQAGALPDEVRYDVWVGEDNLARKMVTSREMGGLEVMLTEWGEPVQIEAPPPGQVQEMPTNRG
jgi:hypothetical protein